MAAQLEPGRAAGLDGAAQTAGPEASKAIAKVAVRAFFHEGLRPFPLIAPSRS